MPNFPSSPPARPALFWLAALVLLVTAAVLLRDVLLPFVAGLALAYLLDPLVNQLERLGIYRGAATLLILVAFFAGAILLLLLALPVITAEITILIEKLPGYVKGLQALAVDPSHPSISKAIGVGIEEAERSSGELASLGAGWLSEFLRTLWSDGRMLLSIFSLLVVTPIITAYLVYDWNRIIATLDRLIPTAHADTVRALVREIDSTVAGFLRGQATICLILGIFYALALRALGLNHGLLIGAFSGLLGFVPYFGSLTGLLLSLGVAIAQFGLSWTPILLVLGIFLVGQSLSDYVLAPYFVGNKVHLNPVWLMFALFSFGYLFGFVGLLIAVPLAASIGVLVRFALRQQPASAVDCEVEETLEAGVDLGKTLGERPAPRRPRTSAT
ncbi:MAG TPA: AI-2E family transporter [Hyphomicrobiaceae bacterium]|jgi:predicted PurR-regulated permease PerM|nr:AI-2E family transporter [Hyphomicrobiaceae bacterium]